MEKFQIYYQPKKGSNIKSLSLKLSEFNEDESTYKMKILLEAFGEKYKIKKYSSNLAEISEKISRVNFNDIAPEQINYDNDYYLIRHGDKKIETNDKTKIQYILDMFEFDDVDTNDISQFVLCD